MPGPQSFVETYPHDQTTVTLTINGLEWEVLSRSLRIRQILGSQVDTASFAVKRPEPYRPNYVANNLHPRPGLTNQVVITITDGTSTHTFRGFISRVREVKIATGTYRYDCEAVDYTADLQRLMVNELYVNKTSSEIAEALLKKYAPFVSTSGIAVTQSKIKSIAFNRQYANQAMDRLAQIEGYEWYIDNNRTCQFYNPATTAVSTMAITDNSKNFVDLSIEPQVDQVRNRITVVGGSVESDTIVEQFVMTGDPNQTFQLKYFPVIAEFWGPAIVLQNALEGSTPVNEIILAIIEWENGAKNHPNVFMRIQESDGEMQPVLCVSSDIADNELVEFILEPQSGLVRRGAYKNVKSDDFTRGRLVEFRYKTPVQVMAHSEDRDAQLELAQLEGTDYATVIATDDPTYWWRLNDSHSLRTVTNTIVPTQSGTYIGDVSYPMAGPLSAGQGGAARFYNGFVLMNHSGAAVPKTSITLEAWVQATPAPSGSRGIVGAWGNNKGAALIISGENYCLLRNDEIFVASGRVTGGWDYVAAQLNAANPPFIDIVVNKEVTHWTPFGAIYAATHIHSGMEIGRYGYQDHSRLRGRIAEVAVYPRAIGTDRMSYHEDAGRHGGIRETEIVDNDVSTLEQAQAVADSQLMRYARPLYNVSFRSYTPGWQVGTYLPVVVSGIGITPYSGGAVIQTVDIMAMGSQTVEFRVGAVSARYNLIDYFRELAKTRDIVRPEMVVINKVRRCEPVQTALILEDWVVETA